MNAAPTTTQVALEKSKDGVKPILQVKHLKKHFPVHKGILNRQVGAVKAVDDVSFELYPNETLGLVGESGCGKTTAGRTLLRLIEPTAGEVWFHDQNIVGLPQSEMRNLRRKMQIIFQDPFSSLNPRMTVESLIGEAIEFHGIASGSTRREMVESLLERVGLQPAYITRYPHEFSGGQRQRLGIARAIALNPDFIVCDEAVSALDVSVQAQVINLLLDLQQDFNLSYLFIAHDLSVVHHISDRVAVMYLGQIVEMASRDDLFSNSLHPYTQALLSAIPQPNPRKRAKRVILTGDVPSPLNPPSGCRFHTRCPAAYGPCAKHEPEVLEVEPGHIVRCHLYDPKFAPTDPTIFAKLPRPPATDKPVHVPEKEEAAAIAQAISEILEEPADDTSSQRPSTDSDAAHTSAAKTEIEEIKDPQEFEASLSKTTRNEARDTDPVEN